MPEADAPWRIRLATEDGQVRGAGVLVGPRVVLTTSSVVRVADEARTDVPFQATFQVANGPTAVARWQAGSSPGLGEVELLTLDDPAPPGTATSLFSDVEPGVAVRAFGYPSGHDDGLWSTAEVLGRRESGGSWIQLTAGDPPISAGFGGAGVVDGAGRAVGMIVAAGDGAAWMLPGDVLREALGRLARRPEGGAYQWEGDAIAFPKRVRALVDYTAYRDGRLGNGSPLLVVTGHEGSGRTSLLRSYRPEAAPERVIGVRGLTLEQLQVEICEVLGEPVERRLDVLIGRMTRPGAPTPWILDDVDRASDPAAVMEFLRALVSAFGPRAGGGSRVVVTGTAGAAATEKLIRDLDPDVLRLTSDQYFDPAELTERARRELAAGPEPHDEQWIAETAAYLAELVGTEWTLGVKMARRLAALPDPDPAAVESALAETRGGGGTAGRTGRSEAASPVPRIARDYWTTDDWLSHRYYARAIAAFLRHRDTKPPLTIGVKGAWGTGKTSLMRMVQEILDPGAAAGEPCRISFDHRSGERIRAWLGQGGGEQVSNEAVVRAAGSPEDEAAEAPEELRADPVEPEGDGWRATVWFNPWMYQSGDQVWAGLAHEIIAQVTSRLTVADRERFWLRLNLARVDREAVRRRWHRILLGRLVPLAAWWVVLTLLAVGLAVVAVGLRVAGVLAPVLPVVSWGGSGVWAAGSAVLAGMSVWRWVRTARAPAAGALGRLIQQPPMLRGLGDDLGVGGPDAVGSVLPEPGYAQRLGFLHLVQTDMRRVLDLVATERRPLVVFVDDLDRCSPGTVAQVIEAVNLFLAGEFPNCVFVLAFDPAVVATHVEVAYKDLAGAVADGRDPGWSSLGWRFLEKIVQLPLGLPPPDPDRDITRYVDQLLGDDETQPQADARGARETEERLVAEIRRQGPSTGTLVAAAGAAQREVLQREGPLGPEALAAAERIFAELYSDRGARPAILAALPALGSRNPRELKRYVNLFRFYTFVAERERLRGLPAPDGGQIAKLAAFAIRWPQLTSRLGAARRDEPHPLAVLEEAARAEDTGDPDPAGAGWIAALAGAGLAGTGQPAWGPALRAFLAAEPAIGGVACRLL